MQDVAILRREVAELRREFVRFRRRFKVLQREFDESAEKFHLNQRGTGELREKRSISANNTVRSEHERHHRR